MAVVTFWHGAPLNRFRRLCLASQAKHAGGVTLYSYREVKGLPAGVVQADAEPILPFAFAEKLRPQADPKAPDRRTLLQLSDFLRMRLLRHGLGLWLDTDLYLHKPLLPDPVKPLFAWEGPWRVGNSALYLPPEHSILADYDALIAADDLWPPWFSSRLRFLRWWRGMRAGAPIRPADLSAAMYGPLLLTVLARRHGALAAALPKESFYSVHARPELFFGRSDYRRLLDNPAILGFHVSPKERGDEAPAPGSLYAWAERQFG